MTLAEAEKCAMQILKQVMEEKISSTNVELAVVTAEDKKFTLRDEQYLNGIIESLDESPI